MIRPEPRVVQIDFNVLKRKKHFSPQSMSPIVFFFVIGVSEAIRLKCLVQPAKCTSIYSSVKYNIILWLGIRIHI